MNLLARIFGTKNDTADLRPLYDLVVATGRDPSWYREGGVPDTVDGRFDMVSAILSLVLLRLDGEGDAARCESVLLTEIFVSDMDASLRQIGIGDFVVGKHIGKMMSALGGRLGAFRSAVDPEAQAIAVRRNIFREAPPSEEKVSWVADRLRAFESRLRATSLVELMEGKLK